MLREASTTQREGIKIYTDLCDDECVWHALIKGPEGSLYEALCFWIEIRFPVDYPASSMQMRFLTPCEHPNVMITTGEICADIFHRAADQSDGGWSAMMVTYTVLLAVRSILDDPNPSSPLNMRFAQAYMAMAAELDPERKRAMWNHMKAAVTQVHAKGPEQWMPSPADCTFHADGFVIATTEPAEAKTETTAADSAATTQAADSAATLPARKRARAGDS